MFELWVCVAEIRKLSGGQPTRPEARVTASVTRAVGRRPQVQPDQRCTAAPVVDDEARANSGSRIESVAIGRSLAFGVNVYLGGAGAQAGGGGSLGMGGGCENQGEKLLTRRIHAACSCSSATRALLSFHSRPNAYTAPSDGACTLKPQRYGRGGALALRSALKSPAGPAVQGDSRLSPRFCDRPP